MALGYSAFQSSFEHAEDRTQKSRADKAQAFREYKDAMVSAGEDVDPLALDRVRMSMVGNDPYMASLIPGGAALQEMAKRMNEQSNLQRMKIASGVIENQKSQNEDLQQIVNQYWDKSPEEVANGLQQHFGDNGAQIYNQYKDDIPGMLTLATNRKLTELSTDPRAALLQEPDDKYKYFTTEARNPQIAKILDQIAAENKRKRLMENTSNTLNITSKLPPEGLVTPQQQEQFGNLVANASGYDSKSAMPSGQAATISSLLSTMGQQGRSTLEAKLVDTASKNVYLQNAAKIGDETAYQAAIKNTMVLAGMPEPTGENDPNYQWAKGVIDNITKTNTIATYQKRQSDVEANYITMAKTVDDNAKTRFESVANGAFVDMTTFGVKGTGKDAKKMSVDPRIAAAVELVRTNSNFFGSDHNIQAAIDFIKTEYLSSKEKFDPAAVAGKFMDQGDFEQKTDWVKTQTQAQMEQEVGIAPGTNFNGWLQERQSTLTDIATSVLDAVAAPTNSREEYEHKVRIKNQAVQELRNEVNRTKQLIDQVATDPSKRNALVSFDQQRAIATSDQLETAIRALEAATPPAPANAYLAPNQVIAPVAPANPNISSGTSFIDQLNNQRDLYRSAGKMQAEPDDNNFTRGLKAVQRGAVETSYWADPSRLVTKPMEWMGESMHWLFDTPGGKPSVTQSGTAPSSQPNPTADAPNQYTPISYETNGASRLDNFLNAMQSVESGGNANAKNPNSSATGNFQFVAGTWKSMVDRYGDRFGVRQEDINDPRAQRLMAAQYTIDNAMILAQTTGRRPNEGELYLAHFMGPGGATQVINAQGTNLLAAQMFPAAAKANPSIFYRNGMPLTVEQLYQKVTGKINRKLRDA